MAFVVSKGRVFHAYDRQSAECIADDLYWSKGGEAEVVDSATLDFGRKSSLELARKLPWWSPTRWALFLRL